MSDLLFQGLIITGIGMGLVFVAIVFLWGLMALMVHLDSRIGQAVEMVSTPAARGTGTKDQSAKSQAAAAAVAVALASKKVRITVSEMGSHRPVSEWKQVQRAQVLQEKSRVIMHRQDRRS
ncbi:MAG: OadG family protein [Leptolinea sp.]|nr:OadG family protein [Leptolinea sp.]